MLTTTKSYASSFFSQSADFEAISSFVVTNDLVSKPRSTNPLFTSFLVLPIVTTAIFLLLTNGIT